ncbi:MAG TPA: flagellar filament capping protein FliD [Bryobacteraceae bacterium]|nr:flagellar filament capping protein FliD [Bryobacteraceae bacterium]
MSTTPSSTTYFAGSSTFAAQLQQTITHAVSAASAPLQQLQTQQTTLTGQQTELQTISTDFTSIQAAVDSLTSSTGVGAFSASVDDNTIASASVGAGVMAGTYSLDILSIGSQTNAVSTGSLTKVADPTTSNIDSGTSFTLTVNGTNYSISDSGGTLSGLAQAINSSSANVQASVVNVGSGSSPDYRLSLQSLSYAPDTIQLGDANNSSLLSTISTGSNVTYQVNGQPSTPISSNTRSATLSTGLNVQFLKTGTTQITVSQSASGIESALSSFANAYNSIMTELNKNRGQGGGALAGDSIVYQLQNALTSLANFSGGSGAVQSLSAIGLSFDSSGNLSFDSGTFSATASSNPNDVLNFIGTATSGGFLQTANSMITSVTDPTTGIIAGDNSTIASQLTTIGTKITTDQAQVSQLQTTLTAQMATADATISSLQNQLTEVTDLFAQMQTNERLATA